VIITRAFQAQRRLASGDALRISALLTATFIFVGAAVQKTFASKDFGSLWDSLWWAVTTVTTVGYGDLYPTTIQGRLIGMLLMIVGVAFMAVLTASIAARFVQTDTEPENEDVLEALRRLEADVREIKATLNSVR
jgi:voltage-gated potassium channel